MTEFLIKVYLRVIASVDVTAKTNFLTDSANCKHTILSRAKINIHYQKNDGRGVRYRTIAQHLTSIT